MPGGVIIVDRPRSHSTWGNQLVDLILPDHEQLDSRHKGLIALKRVYVPESIEEAGE